MGRLDFEPFVFHGTLTCEAIPLAVDDLSRVDLMVSVASNFRQPPIFPNAEFLKLEPEVVG